MSDQPISPSFALIQEARAFQAKKLLGQHFLVDPDVLGRIVDALELEAGENVVEIGPGIGFLTRLLSTTGATITAVDLDREAIARLQTMNLPKTILKHGDFLNFDLNSLEFFPRRKNKQPDCDEADAANSDAPGNSASRQGASAAHGQQAVGQKAGKVGAEFPTGGDRRFKVVGNIPYQITGLIIGYILGELDKPSPWIGSVDKIVLTVQQEVARRMVAKAGDDDYSKVSLLVNYYCEGEIEAFIPAQAFYPPPRVTSAIVKLTPRVRPAVQCQNTRLLRQIIEAGFRQRRKMYRNSLGFLKLEQGQINQVFDQLGIDPLVRPERLSLQQFAILADAFHVLVKAHATTESALTSQAKSDL